MKVRHKQHRDVVRNVVASQMVQNAFCYIFDNHQWESVAEWEEIKPEPTYRDVTGECEIDGEGDLWDNGHGRKGDYVWMTTNMSRERGYRLRKVQLLKNRIVDGKSTGVWDDVWAFIVEKKEST